MLFFQFNQQAILPYLTADIEAQWHSWTSHRHLPSNSALQLDKCYSPQINTWTVKVFASALLCSLAAIPRATVKPSAPHSTFRFASAWPPRTELPVHVQGATSLQSSDSNLSEFETAPGYCHSKSFWNRFPISWGGGISFGRRNTPWLPATMFSLCRLHTFPMFGRVDVVPFGKLLRILKYW